MTWSGHEGLRAMGYNARNGRKQGIELLLLLLFLLHFLQPLAVSYTRHATYLAELEPPARYNHPYNGPVIERVIPLAELHKICGYDGAACAWVTDGTCYLVLPSDYGQASVPIYRRHETAHCNGWPQNHPPDG